MKMEFDSKQIHNYLSLIKGFESELLAYRVVYEFVSRSGLFPVGELANRLIQARASVQQEMDEKYNETLRTLANINDQSSALAALKLLAEWKPKGPPN
jgi:hypothetical protein